MVEHPSLEAFTHEANLTEFSQSVIIIRLLLIYSGLAYLDEVLTKSNREQRL